MKEYLHNHIHAFLPHDQHVPGHGAVRVVMGILGGVGLLSIVGSFFGFSVDAASLEPVVSYETESNPIILKSINLAPTASAGVDQTLILPVTTTTLDASASKDTDGRIVVYYWRQVSGPNFATLKARSTIKPVISNLVEGKYVFEVRVTDNGRRSTKDTVEINVGKPATAANNKPAVADAGKDQIVRVNSKVTLDASNSADADGYIISINWRQVSGPTTVTLAAIETNMQVTTSTLSAGKYVFELRLEDDKGAASTDQVQITVTK